MKKILGISLVAVLAVSPLMARAEAVAGEPAVANPVADTNVAASGPQYALAQANATNDGKVATAGYVKGAYNASIKAINKVAKDLSTLSTTADGTYATKTALASETAARTEADTEINEKIGDTALATTSQTLTGAINEVKDSVTTLATTAGNTYATKTELADEVETLEGADTAINNKIGDTTLATTAQTLTGAINEVNTAVSNLNTSANSTYATKTGAVATVNAASATYTPAGTINDVVIDTMNNWDLQTGSEITKSVAFTGTQATINPQVSEYQQGA